MSMSDDDARESVEDLQKIAERKLYDHPDKEMALLWDDVCSVLADYASGDRTSLAKLFQVLVHQHLYVDQLQSELRFRLESLEMAVGLNYSAEDGAVHFPPSGMRPSLPEGNQSLATRLALLDERVRELEH